MSGGIQQQRQMVEQLRREAANKRLPLSQTVEDIKVKCFLLTFIYFSPFASYLVNCQTTMTLLLKC